MIHNLCIAILGLLLHVLLDVGLLCLSLTELISKLMLPSSTSLHLDSQIDTWRGGQAEGSRDLLQVELVNIEDVSLLVTGVCLEV